MTSEYKNTLRAYAHALSHLGKTYTDLASRHRMAASAIERGKQKITYDRHFSDWLRRMTELSAAAERLLALEIELARSFGVTWEEVGAALGVSRQAAWDRFANHERWQRSRRISQLQVSRRSVRKAEILREVRDLVNRSEIDLLALKDWLNDRPPSTQAR